MTITAGHVIFALFISALMAAYTYVFWATPIINLRDKKGSIFMNVIRLFLGVAILIGIILAVLANLNEATIPNKINIQ